MQKRFSSERRVRNSFIHKHLGWLVGWLLFIRWEYQPASASAGGIHFNDKRLFEQLQLEAEREREARPCLSLVAVSHGICGRVRFDASKQAPWLAAGQTTRTWWQVKFPPPWEGENRLRNLTKDVGEDHETFPESDWVFLWFLCISWSGTDLYRGY